MGNCTPNATELHLECNSGSITVDVAVGRATTKNNMPSANQHEEARKKPPRVSTLLTSAIARLLWSVLALALLWGTIGWALA